MLPATQGSNAPVHKPTIKCKVKIVIDRGNTEWGAEIGKTYFVLKILKVEDLWKQ